MSRELDELRATVEHLDKRIHRLEGDRARMADAISKSNQLSMKLVTAAMLSKSDESDEAYEQAIALLKEIHDQLTPRRNRP